MSVIVRRALPQCPGVGREAHTARAADTVTTAEAALPLLGLGIAGEAFTGTLP